MSEVNSPLEDDQSATLVRGSVTGFEQGIAAVAGLFTAGPLGALASWAVIRGVQGKWTPWFIVGIPSAIAINAFYFGIFYGYTTIANSGKQQVSHLFAKFLIVVKLNLFTTLAMNESLLLQTAKRVLGQLSLKTLLTRQSQVQRRI